MAIEIRRSHDKDADQLPNEPKQKPGNVETAETLPKRAIESEEPTNHDRPDADRSTPASNTSENHKHHHRKLFEGTLDF